MRKIRIFGEHAELRVRHLDEGLSGWGAREAAREGQGQEQASYRHGFSW
jgi:hypothetical protein